MTAVVEEAYADFVRHASPSLARTAWLLTGDGDAAAELVQAALVKALLAWKRLPPGGELAYVRRILVNENVDRWRRRHGEIAVGQDFDRATGESLEDRVADRDRVARMLATLPDNQRRVVVLRFYEDLTEQQVAETLGMTVGAVKAASHRAMTTLRQHYRPAAGDGVRVAHDEGGRR